MRISVSLLFTFLFSHRLCAVVKEAMAAIAEAEGDRPKQLINAHDECIKAH